jgi:hypothetical protein
MVPGPEAIWANFFKDRENKKCSHFFVQLPLNKGQCAHATRLKISTPNLFKKE